MTHTTIGLNPSPYLPPVRVLHLHRCSSGQGSDLMNSQLSLLEISRGMAHVSHRRWPLLGALDVALLPRSPRPQVLEALQFSSQGAGNPGSKRRIHLDVAPQSIWLTPDGQWRLAGWGFSLELDVSESSTPCPYFLASGPGAMAGKAPPVGPSLAYAAPELSNAATPGGTRALPIPALGPLPEVLLLDPIIMSISAPGCQEFPRA